MNNRNLYRIVWFLVGVVLVMGCIFPPLMDYDAAEYAGIAMNMLQEHDWINIINRQYGSGELYDYLDKPHMLFWSALVGYKLLGLNHMGYRLFSILLTLAAAFATGRLGRRLYNEQVGRWAALFFVTAQSILHANHDVRTDSLLTSFVILAVWQVVVFLDTRKTVPLFAGFVFLAFGVGTKGMIAALTAGCLVFFYLVGKKAWRQVFDWKWILGIAAFAIGLSPFLALYYLQFDLHPEKLVNGSTGTSGVKFLLWSQSFERFAGGRSFVSSPEYSFFLHTFLWAFLPWSLLTVFGVAGRIRDGIQTRFQAFFQKEELTFAGVWVMFFIMSLSKFKLPHYLNILFPFFAVFTAAYLWESRSKNNERWGRILLGLHYALIGGLLLLLLVLTAWSFPLKNPWVVLGALGFLGFLVYLVRMKHSAWPDRLVLFSATGILLVNFILNTHFFPALEQYQAGSTMAAAVEKEGIPRDQVYGYGEVVRTFDFYSGRYVPMLTDQEIRQKIGEGQPFYVFAPAPHSDLLHQRFPTAELVMETPDKHITKLSPSFFHPEKRLEGLPHAGLFLFDGMNNGGRLQQ